MNLLLMLIFSGAAIVNFFDTRAAVWLALAGLIFPLVMGMVGR